MERRSLGGDVVSLSRPAPACGADVADRLLCEKVRPSRQLMEEAAAEVKERTQ
ncbi:hypothetical protein AB0I72_24640 [Nocardiopsis sp. NPDC049922]|uniref:hypothetical protein n=1 Tax=Nocardiopsis sp. NPDC049922 TaxID=3155157 RepID=UPI00340D70AC